MFKQPTQTLFRMNSAYTFTSSLFTLLSNAARFFEHASLTMRAITYRCITIKPTRSTCCTGTRRRQHFNTWCRTPARMSGNFAVVTRMQMNNNFICQVTHIQITVKCCSVVWSSMWQCCKDLFHISLCITPRICKCKRNNFRLRGYWCGICSFVNLSSEMFVH